MGDGDSVAFNAGHYKRCSHLHMIHSICTLIQFGGTRADALLALTA